MKTRKIIVASMAILALAGCTATNTTDTTSSSTSQTTETKNALSNIEKAKEIIKSFETGDQTAIKEYVSEDTYIQHNLSVPDGREVVLGSIKNLADAGTTVEIVRSFEDGDYVVLHSKYKIAGGAEQAGFDIFRFENGKIVEHWDNLQNLGEKNPSGHTMLDGDTKVVDGAETTKNKELVQNFVTDILVNKDLSKAKDYFNGDNYIQHNPSTGDGVEATINGFQGLIDSGFDMTYKEIKMVLGQGNFVLVASQGTMMEKDTVFYDLFRVENGKIAEHWDTVEETLPQDQWANQNGKF